MTAPAGLASLMAAYAPAPLPGGTIDANIGGAITNQGVYDVSATQNYMLGTKFRSKTGKLFTYNKKSAAALAILSATNGSLLQGPAVETKFIAQTQSVNYATAPAGAYEIVVDVTTASAAANNALAGGRLWVKSADGIGDSYDIVASVLDYYDTNMHLLLAQPIRTAFTASTVISMRPSKHNGVIVAPTTLTGPVVGAVVAPYNATNGNVIPASYYFWAQCNGEGPAVIDGTVVIGQPVMASSNIAGAVMAAAPTEVGTTAAYTLPNILGIVRDIGATQTVGLVDWKIEV
jgi:hypothetical protein